MAANYALILAGGAGTRLWPISRQNRPKQFQTFVGETTLLQHMVSHTSAVVPLERIFIMATPEFGQIIRDQIPGLPPENLLFEPSRRDNGPAILLAMAQIRQRDPEAIVGILWSDHLIQRPTDFSATLTTAFAAALANPEALVTVGARPGYPDTGLGYIQMGSEIAPNLHAVETFIEKPDLPTATTFVESGEYLWNVGYKFIGVDRFLTVMAEAQPELPTTVESLSQGYDQLPKLSIEYLLTQYMSGLLVVPSDFGWSDIGNWNTLHEQLQNEHGLATRGAVIPLDTKNSLVFAKDRPIVTLGVENLIIVDDGDVILVLHKDAVGQIKRVTETVAVEHPELL